MNLDWTHGNRFALLENGEAFYPRVFEAISLARREVLLETFILHDDKVGRQLQQALLQAARQGAEVHVLVDGWGSPDLPADFTGPLAEAGVRMRAYEPVSRLFGRLDLFRRMHRKLVVVDGRIAFIGGINYSIDHLDEFGPKAKQDYAVAVEGPLVAQVHAFCRASLEQPQPQRSAWWPRRRRRAPRAVAAAARAEGAAALVTRDNLQHSRDIEMQYRIALRRAQRRVLIANAYFFPGLGLLRDLRRAARRGVQVDLVVQGEPDMMIAQLAASLLYAQLLRAGVRLHEYCQRPFHGKVATVDDEWATVGSSNLDPLSLALNLEANVIIRDPDFASQLRQRLDELIADSCRQVTPARPTRLSTWLMQVRGFLVFHFLRRFPVWLGWLPRRTPRVEQLQTRVQ